jgi:hypothetical protein
LLLERQRSQQLAECVHEMEQRLAAEQQLVLDGQRELESARDGLTRWRNTAQAVEKQFVSLKVGSDCIMFSSFKCYAISIAMFESGNVSPRAGAQQSLFTDQEGE